MCTELFYSNIEALNIQNNLIILCIDRQSSLLFIQMSYNNANLLHNTIRRAFCDCRHRRYINIHKYGHYVIGLWEYEYTNTCTYECTRANGSSTGAYLNKIVEIGLSAAHADAPPTRCGQ